MRHFYVETIEIITEDHGHAKMGSVMAKGRDGWYIYQPRGEADYSSHLEKPNCWPDPDQSGIKLWRDHWMFLADYKANYTNTRPFFLDHLQAPRAVIKEMQDTMAKRTRDLFNDSTSTIAVRKAAKTIDPNFEMKRRGVVTNYQFSDGSKLLVSGRGNNHKMCVT